ncbi:hypothetical protein ACOSQ2_004656 [Xanthoceras sorbifolium]
MDSRINSPDFSSLAKTLNSNLPLKLDKTNYIYWKTQVMPAIPDQILLCWLLGTLSPSVLGQVTRCITSLEMWTKLERVYSQQSIARILQLRQQLQSIKKGSDSISDFVLKLKNIGDVLLEAGEDVSERDLLLALMNGVGHEYDSVLCSKPGHGALQCYRHFDQQFQGLPSVPNQQGNQSALVSQQTQNIAYDAGQISYGSQAISQPSVNNQQTAYYASPESVNDQACWSSHIRSCFPYSQHHQLLLLLLAILLTLLCKCSSSDWSRWSSKSLQHLHLYLYLYLGRLLNYIFSKIYFSDKTSLIKLF